jgi:hypothetical protein
MTNRTSFEMSCFEIEHQKFVLFAMFLVGETVVAT